MTALMELVESLRGALAQLVERPKLDRVRGAGLGTGRLHVVAKAVVTEGALPNAPVILTLVEDAERAGDHAVAAAVADVLLHDHRPELGPEERARGADVETARVGAVLADVRAHEPAEAVAV